MSKRSLKARVEKLELRTNPKRTILVWKDEEGYHVEGKVMSESEYKAWYDNFPPGANVKILVLQWRETEDSPAKFDGKIKEGPRQ